MLEATVIGSFTKIGPSVRSKLYEWDEDIPDVHDLTVLITGGSSGLGRETARQLVEGATVYLTSRDQSRAEEVANEINGALTEESAGTAIGAALDTADPDSVRELADRIKLETDALDVLIHNAGALTDTYDTNVNDIELTLASHLVGPYALTKHLRPHLSKGARVLWMSSGGMYTQGLDVDEIEMSENDYRGAIAYARAKRGQVEMVDYLGRQWAPDVIMHSMHPGWVDTDGVAQGLPGFGELMGPLLRDVGDGADTMVWLAAGGADDAEPGQFWLDRKARATSYLPGTGTDDGERERLVEWLELTTLPWKIG